jgi:hypothetical protein
LLSEKAKTMRDDLHRTVPLTRPWQSVVKFASREADWKRVPDAISRAVRCEVDAGLEPKWASDFKEGLLPSETDFFEEERLSRFIDDFSRQDMTPRERQLIEIAKGLLARDGSANLYAHAIAELYRQVLHADIEQVTARVREIWGARQASEVRQGLLRAATECSFAEVPKTKTSTKHNSVAILLSEAIELNI